MHKLFTIGYQTLQDYIELKALSSELGALVADIRYNPWSPNPKYRKSYLQAYLGDSYRHIQSLGNRNYKSGGVIEIAGFETGFYIVKEELKKRPVILMCACRVLEDCHRLDVAEMIQAELPDIEIEHLIGSRGQ